MALVMHALLLFHSDSLRSSDDARSHRAIAFGSDFYNIVPALEKLLSFTRPVVLHLILHLSECEFLVLALDCIHAIPAVVPWRHPIWAWARPLYENRLRRRRCHHRVVVPFTAAAKKAQLDLGTLRRPASYTILCARAGTSRSRVFQVHQSFDLLGLARSQCRTRSPRRLRISNSPLLGRGLSHRVARTKRNKVDQIHLVEEKSSQRIADAPRPHRGCGPVLELMCVCAIPLLPTRLHQKLLSLFDATTSCLRMRCSSFLLRAARPPPCALMATATPHALNRQPTLPSRKSR